MKLTKQYFLNLWWEHKYELNPDSRIVLHAQEWGGANAQWVAGGFKQAISDPYREPGVICSAAY